LEVRSATKAATAVANRKSAALAALAVVAAALAISVVPFSDYGQRCGPPITSAGHGKTVVTWLNSAFLPSGVPVASERTTYCRHPARVRLAIAGSTVAAVFVFTVRWRVLDPRARAVRIPDH
jgi:hypothetical protein